MNIGEVLKNIWETSGFSAFTWQQGVMILIALVLLYLGIAKKFEPLLLVGIAFGMFITNIPGTDAFHPEMWTVENVDYLDVLQHGEILDILYIGVKTGLYPCVIFIGVGAMRI